MLGLARNLIGHAILKTDVMGSATMAVAHLTRSELTTASLGNCQILLYRMTESLSARAIFQTKLASGIRTAVSVDVFGMSLGANVNALCTLIHTR